VVAEIEDEIEQRPARRPSKENLQLACSQLEQKFCEGFVAFDGDRVKAAVGAGYSEKSAKQQAWILLKRPHVIAYIERLMFDKNKRDKINKDWVLDTLYEEATDLERKGTTQASRVRATEIIARIKGYLEPENQTTVIVPTKVFIGIDYDKV